MDFEIAEDLIELDAGSSPRSDRRSTRRSSGWARRAKDADDHILYHAKSGRVFYDDDGLGGDDAVQIARLDKKLDLDEGQFLVA